MSSAPRSRHIRSAASRNDAEPTFTPLSPWTTSRITAAVRSVTAASSAATLLNAMWVVSSSGPNPSRYFGSQVTDSAPIVRPWNPLRGGHERRPPGQQPRELERAVHGFGAAVGKENVRQISGSTCASASANSARTSLYK